MASYTPILTHVKTLEFDLYLDESGDFSSSDKQWLIGGYLVPFQENHAPQAQNWWQQVLDAVDGRWPGKRGTYYKLAHCTDSRNEMFYGEMPRSEVQPMVLEILVRCIREANGFPVVFMCPKGSCLQNAEFNFIGMLSRGYGLLQAHLQSMYPGTVIRIIPHISHRIETHGTWLGHDGTDEGIRRAYIAHIHSGAYGLCDMSQLKDTLQMTQLITTSTPPSVTDYGDLKRANESASNCSNLYNVIADYICNSYYNLNKNHYEEMLKDTIVISITRDGILAPQVVIRNPSVSLPKPDEPQIISARQLLLGRGGVYQFNSFDPDVQRSLVERLCEEIHPLVMRQEQMESTDRDLCRLLEISKDIHNDSIRSELKSNLLLFRIAIANHFGKIEQTDELYSDFRSALDGIEDTSIRNALVAMFYNRRIVLNTDLFDYAGAEEVFTMMQNYWENHLDSYGRGLAAPGPEPSMTNIVCPEYGRTIGSILQTACHMMRVSTSRAERNAIYMEALNRAHIAKLHLTSAYDLSRHEQTLSHLETEAGNFDHAFRCLLRAAQLIGGEPWAQRHAAALDESEGNVTPARCLAILSVVGVPDSKGRKAEMNEPFMLSHYLRLACEMSIAGCSDAGIMLQTLRENGRGVLLANSYNVIRAIHPRTQILWKLGSLAARCGLTDEGGKLMREAFKQLSGSKTSVFRAIAVAVNAEYISLQLSGPGDRLRELRAEYARFIDEKPLFMRDPFAARGVNGPLTGGEFTAEDMMNISRVIAY